MGWRTWVGLSLSGSLSRWKSRYQNDAKRFNYRSVWCSVSEWNGGRTTISASAHCSDPEACGLGAGSVASFYQSRGFRSRTEAEGHLEAEVRKAAARHPTTRFYRRRPLAVIEDGRISTNEVMIEECYVDGAWHAVEKLPPFATCPGCGHETSQKICERCGEPIWV